MRILSIGNSFSQDAQFYLHKIAQAAGKELTCVNLYIPGCPLSRHAENIRTDACAYRYELNGEYSDRMSSISSALTEGNWDIITLQQVSGKSGIFSTYLPYLTELYEYVKERAPKSGIYIHQTWAYETDSSHQDFAYYGRDRERMHECIRDAYRNAAELLGVKMIKTGDVIASLRKTEPFIYEKGGISLCRDGFHMSMLYGRYAAAATFYSTLCADIYTSPFIPEYNGISAEEKYTEIIKKTVSDLT